MQPSLCYQQACLGTARRKKWLDAAFEPGTTSRYSFLLYSLWGHIQGSTTLPAACWDLAPGHETIDKSHAQQWERERRGRKTH